MPTPTPENNNATDSRTDKAVVCDASGSASDYVPAGYHVVEDADGERLVKNESLDIRALLSEARHFVEIYAANNPRWNNHYNSMQDPHGVHDLLKRITTALSSPNTPVSQPVEHRSQKESQ